jgi:hypothetical protein
VTTDEEPDWRPDGWADWTYERRRIWRLEQQLLRWEALAFAARSFAHEQAAIVAELRGEAKPTQADIDRIVFEGARSRWKPADSEAPEPGPFVESDRASQLDDPDNWVGGFYELALELGPADDERLEAAISAVCTHTGAVGWYAVGDRRPVAAERLPCTWESIARHGQLRGTVQLPRGEQVVCGLVVVREEGGSYEPDWLDFYIPLGALGRIDSRVGGYPFGDFAESLQWRRPFDDWLADLGRRVYEEVPFRLGLIGVEVSGQMYSDGLASGVPTSRGNGLLVPKGNEIRYYGATE